MRDQYYQMTLDEAIADYQAGITTSTQLVYFYLRIRMKRGWKVTLHQREISAKLGITKSQFYKAITRIKDKLPNDFDWEAPNGLVVEFLKKPSSENRTSVAKTEPSSENGTSVAKTEPSSEKGKSSSEKGKSSSEKGKSSSEKGKSSSEKGTFTPLKPASDGDRGDLSDLDQILIKFNSSLSQEEREKFRDFCLKKADSLPTPPTLLNKWIQSWIDDLWIQFQTQNPTIGAKNRFEARPDWPDILEAMKKGLPYFRLKGSGIFEDIPIAEREAMIAYAQENDLL